MVCCGFQIFIGRLYNKCFRIILIIVMELNKTFAIISYQEISHSFS